MMGAFEFLTSFSVVFLGVILVGFLVRMKYQYRYKARMLDEKDQSRFTELAARMEKIEKRMANLETIVLDTEKQREFDRAMTAGKESR